MLSYKFWQKHFFGDRAVLGQTLQLDKKNYVIVGVAAPRFTWYSADVFLPLKLMQAPSRRYIIDILLKPGVTATPQTPSSSRCSSSSPKTRPNSFPSTSRCR